MKLSMLIGADLKEALHTFFDAGEDGSAYANRVADSKGDSADFDSAYRDATGKLEGFRIVREFVALPSRRSVQCLAPIGSQQCQMSGLWIYTPFTRRGRLVKSFFLNLAKLGRLGWAPSGLAIASTRPLPLELLIAEITGEQKPFLALSLGTPGRFRKLTIQVMRPDGEVLGYIKLPHTSAAIDQVRHEAAVLQRLWDIGPLRPHIPRVLHAGEWGEAYVLFQSSGPLGDGQIDFGTPHQNFLQTLWSVHQTERPGPELVEEVALNWRKTEALWNTEWRKLAARALERARLDLATAMIPCGISHGDFTPWNIRVKDGRLFIFDWEMARWGQPILWDVFHFHSQVSSLLRKKRAWVAPPTRSSIESASLLLYLLSSACLLFEKGCERAAEIEYRQRAILERLSQNIP